jgi:5-methylcytosine-specific restriction endonuclease McrA
MDQYKSIKVSTRQLPRKGINLKAMSDYILECKQDPRGCRVCSYKRSLKALHFHHLDPKTKLFGIGQFSKANSLDQLKEEIAKCVLLCSNCHTEVHDGITVIP